MGIVEKAEIGEEIGEQCTGLALVVADVEETCRALGHQLAPFREFTPPLEGARTSCDLCGLAAAVYLTTTGTVRCIVGAAPYVRCPREGEAPYPWTVGPYEDGTWPEGQGPAGGSVSGA